VANTDSHVSLFMPVELRAELERSVDDNDRSLSAERLGDLRRDSHSGT